MSIQAQPLPAPATLPLRWTAAIFPALMREEGGHSNSKIDHGGETNFGISLRFLKAVGNLDVNKDGLRDLDLNFDTVLDGRDIRLITPDIASPIYFHHFCSGPGFDTLPERVDAMLVDQAVNGGTTAAIKLLQRSCNAVINARKPIGVDGALGPKTRAAVDRVIEVGLKVTLVAAYRQAAAARYRAIVAADATQAGNLKGWLARASRLGNV